MEEHTRFKGESSFSDLSKKQDISFQAETENNSSILMQCMRWENQLCDTFQTEHSVSKWGCDAVIASFEIQKGGRVSRSIF